MMLGFIKELPLANVEGYGNGGGLYRTRTHLAKHMILVDFVRCHAESSMSVVKMQATRVCR